MAKAHFSKIYWLWIPIAAIVMQAGLEFFLTSETLTVLHSETGPHEFLQFVLMALGFVVAVRILMMPELRNQPLLYGWFGIAALGCFYVAGEEISWGQHVLQWNTPEYWAALNDQGETNLHNTSSWLDQKPRLILEIGILVGGIIIPALQRFKPEWVPEKFSVIYAPQTLIVVALLALGINVVDKIDDALESVVLMERASEVEELYLFYFVLLYLVALKRRLSVA